MIDRVSFFNGDAREATAIIEHRLADARHAVGNRNACETATTRERGSADTRHTIRNRDTREATAIIERFIADARYAAVSRNYTILTSCNQGFTCRFNQTISCTVIHCVSACHRNAFKSAAIRERSFTDIGNTLGNRNTRESGATNERAFTNVGDTLRNCDACKPGTLIKRKLADDGDG